MPRFTRVKRRPNGWTVCLRVILMSKEWSTYIGRGAIRFYLPLAVELQDDFFSQAVVIAKDLAARERLHANLDAALAEQFPAAVSRVSTLGIGPPVGWPVQYRVSGPDLNEVRDIAMQLAGVMAKNSAIRKVNFDWMELARLVRIRIDQDQARLLGLSSQAIASVLNSVVSRTQVTQVRDGIYLVDVIARATDEQRVPSRRYAPCRFRCGLASARFLDPEPGYVQGGAED